MLKVLLAKIVKSEPDTTKGRYMKEISEFLCRFGIHKYIEIKCQRAKSKFGLAHGLPCHRITEKCVKCGHIKYSRTNMSQLITDLHDDYRWES